MMSDVIFPRISPFSLILTGFECLVSLLMFSIYSSTCLMGTDSVYGPVLTEMIVPSLSASKMPICLSRGG